MPRPAIIKQQIDRLTQCLVEIGLVDDQQYCFQRTITGYKIEISFPGAGHISIAMKDDEYAEIYNHLERERAFNLKMVDGAIIQMMYIFQGLNLEQHRLAFSLHLVLKNFKINQIYIWKMRCMLI